jgi:hypothetical protein
MMAQLPGQGPLKKESRDRIEAQRTAFITQKLNLTPDEAAKFWPVYNAHKDELKDLRDDMERPDMINLTDEQATVIIERHLEQEQMKLEMKKKLFSKLRTIIGPKKVLMLHAAEKEFNRELLRRANEFRRN